MAGIYNILASNYSTVGATVLSKTPYVAVDPTDYRGNWEGKYGSGESFKFTISNIVGFRAKVRYQSGPTLRYQDVLIRDGSFKIGDTKFSLATPGKALINTVVTNPATGTNSVTTAYATLDT